MSRAMKAALWSGLVFPGVGHLILKCYARAIVLITICAVALSILLSQATHQADALMQQIESGAVTPTLDNLPALLQNASAQAPDSKATLATWTLVLAWVFGIVDSYRVGKGEDET